jgi:hypothetical protein
LAGQREKNQTEVDELLSMLNAINKEESLANKPQQVCDKDQSDILATGNN